MARPAFRHTREEILGLSVPLFAKVGFDGVSMRDIAAAVGVTPAALYHHFSDKAQLCLAAVGYAFEEKVGPLKSLLEGGEKPWDRLEAFVVDLTRMLAREKDFRRLMQWVLLDNDEQRLQSLADCVFRDLFNLLHKLADELAPGRDAHLLIVSMFGLVIYPFETQSVRRFLPGYQQQHEDPEAIARHVIGLLRNGLGINNKVTSHEHPTQGKRAEQTFLLHDCKEKRR
ncbi:MAG: TetR/AcrR family transcriptional regulator [Rhodoferax sp.]|uniref:TetR/AcrR family transcriptional regulator n=1 Tax=Rhodoferax sp. TaxID=50421 RepID=UPI00261D944E|nr:TetR/AcrR family transcriptional regulator [Rhodoferax sp.]MDD5336667.1 TetR/AcrR family transcriptional regulator [Rhodoferax sp.]